MRNTLALIAALILMAPTPSLAQSDTVTATVVSACGSESLTAGTAASVSQNTAGVQCSGSGAGATATTIPPTYTTGTVNPLSLTVDGSLRVANQPTPTGGLTLFTLTAANTTNATNIKATFGDVYHVSVTNNSATLAYVSFYNTATTPTCGTGIVWQTLVPGNTTSGATTIEDFAYGMMFSSGIGICVTTGIAGTGAVAATAYVVNVGYR